MKGLTTMITGFLLVLGGGLIALVGFYWWASSGRLAASEYAQIKTYDAYALKTGPMNLQWCRITSAIYRD